MIKGKVLFNTVLIELETEEATKGGLIIVNDTNSVKGKEGHLKDDQKVVAIGNMVDHVKVGDIVKVDFDKYMKLTPMNANTPSRKQELQLPIIELDGKSYGRIIERDIIYVYDKEVKP